MLARVGLSVTRAPTSGLLSDGSKDMALTTGCESNAWSSLVAVFFARLSVLTAMCGAR